MRLAPYLLSVVPFWLLSSCAQEGDAGDDPTVAVVQEARVGGNKVRRDAGVDTGPAVADTGTDVATDRGVDTGPADAGPADTGTADTGPTDTGPAADSGSAALPPDNVTYSGSFAVRTGRWRGQLTVAGLVRDVTLYVPTVRAANPPLLLAFHGTNGNGDQIFDESGAQAMADANGVIVIAPDSRWMSGGDWDHATEEGYWQTYPVTSPDQNADLLLVRAIMVEAQRRYAVDPRRVYAIGHSNGGFFAELVATQLVSRIAAYAESSAGLVQCATTLSCRFQGSGTSCAALRTQSGWCTCSGADKPGPVPTSGRIPPAYLTHGTRDPMVSVQYTCALADRMQGAGAPTHVVLRDGDGHVLPATFASDAWAYLSPLRLP